MGPMMIAKLRTLMANKHTSGAAVAYVVLSYLLPYAKPWILLSMTPDRAKAVGDLFDSTLSHLKELCVIWIGISATDAGQLGQVKQEVADLKSGTAEFSRFGGPPVAAPEVPGQPPQAPPQSTTTPTGK